MTFTPSVFRQARAAGLAAVVLLTAAAPSRAAEDPALRAADVAMVAASTKGDAAAVSAMLDTASTWTDANGRTSTKAQVGRTVPAVAVGAGPKVTTRIYDYGQVGVVLADLDKAHALRVWIKRPAGWRLLVHHEVRSQSAAITGQTPAKNAPCENPCGSVPFTAKTDVQRGVLTAYQALEAAAERRDAKDWVTYIADEFALASSNGDRVFDKETRAKGIAQSALGGVAPTRLLTAEMLEFGATVVMRSTHQPEKGDPLQITRVWVRRDGRWQETLSYQTGIRPAAK